MASFLLVTVLGVSVNNCEEKFVKTHVSQQLADWPLMSNQQDTDRLLIGNKPKN